MNDDSHKRRIGELQRLLLEIVKAQPQGIEAKDALSVLASRVTLTPHEASYYEKGGMRRFEWDARFATAGLVKAGWMTKTKGVWAATEAGVKALDTFKDPMHFGAEVDRLYRQWKKAREKNLGDTAEVAPEIAESAEPSAATWTFEESEEAAGAEIRHFLRQVDPYELQSMVAGLLKAMGFHIYFEAPRGPDGGIDIIAFSDSLGSKAPRLKVQVKREEGAVSPDQVRGFMSLIGASEVGIFLNVGGFSRGTHEEVRKQMTRQVTLINGQDFFDLWVKHYGALEDVYKQKMRIRPIYFLAPVS